MQYVHLGRSGVKVSRLHEHLAPTTSLRGFDAYVEAARQRLRLIAVHVGSDTPEKRGR